MSFENGLSDIIGMIGVACILVTYAALQLEKLDPKALPYSFFNALGSALIVISLIQDFNLSAFVIEAAWFLISVFGIIHVTHRRLKKRDEQESQPQP